MIRELKPALVSLAAFTLLLGLAYPLAMTGIAQVLFPHQANGSLTVEDSRVIGSELSGQTFTSVRYFHPRPSAVGYNAAATSGSNLGPTSAELVARIETDIANLRESNSTRVPIDLVTTSGSGIDPHISPAGARFQAARVAEARGLPVQEVLRLVETVTEGRTFGLFGEPRVNVLALNLALDQMATEAENK